MAASGLTVWLTGLPAAGKSTLALAVRARLAAIGLDVHILDGDELRRGLSDDLDLSPAGRAENVRRAGAVAALLARQGAVVVVALVSPYRAGRDAVRRAHLDDEIPFIEVWVATSVEECARRDVKGLYARAAQGNLTGLTGRDAPYEEPLLPEVEIRPTTCDDGTEAILQIILGQLSAHVP